MTCCAGREAEGQQGSAEGRSREDWRVAPGKAEALAREWEEAAAVLTVAIAEAKGTGHEINIPKWKAARHVLQQCTQQLRDIISPAPKPDSEAPKERSGRRNAKGMARRDGRPPEEDGLSPSPSPPCSGLAD